MAFALFSRGESFATFAPSCVYGPGARVRAAGGPRRPALIIALRVTSSHHFNRNTVLALVWGVPRGPSLAWEEEGRGADAWLEGGVGARRLAPSPVKRAMALLPWRPRLRVLAAVMAGEAPSCRQPACDSWRRRGRLGGG